MQGDTLMIPDHTALRCASLGRVEPELVSYLGKVITWDATRRLRFVDHATGWLH